MTADFTRCALPGLREQSYNLEDYFHQKLLSTPYYLLKDDNLLLLLYTTPRSGFAA
jgi:hypothetical protein